MNVLSDSSELAEETHCKLIGPETLPYIYSCYYLFVCLFVFCTRIQVFAKLTPSYGRTNRRYSGSSRRSRTVSHTYVHSGT